MPACKETKKHDACTGGKQSIKSVPEEAHTLDLQDKDFK